MNGKLKITGKGVNLAPMATAANSVSIVLASDGSRYCTTFGGVLRTNTPLKFSAKYAPVPTACAS